MSAAIWTITGIGAGDAFTGAFCAALLSSLTARRKWWAPIAFTWASLLSYSRIYVGKHYLGDVLAGMNMVIGILVALQARERSGRAWQE